MAKFSESPEFLLEKYYSEITESGTDPTQQTDMVGNVYFDICQNTTNWTVSGNVVYENYLNIYDTIQIGPSASNFQQNIGNLTSQTSIEFQNLLTVGSNESNSHKFKFWFDTNKGIEGMWLSDGFYLKNSSGSFVKITTFDDDIFNIWRFLVDHSTSSYTCDVYLNGTLVESNFSCVNTLTPSGNNTLKFQSFGNAICNLLEVKIDNGLIEPVLGQTSYSQGTSLLGLNSGIQIGGYYQDYYIKTDNNYELIRLRPNSTDLIQDKIFNFKVGGDAVSTGTLLSEEYGNLITPPSGDSSYSYYKKVYETSVTLDTFDDGDEIYFREDGPFHEWLDNNETLTINGISYTVKDYLNFFKTYLYFGKLFNEGTSGENANLIFEGLKHYTVEALPQHQRTDRMKELLSLYFDKIHHKGYNLLKNAITLIDPMEVNIDYLSYIANIFNVTYPDNISDRKKRRFVKSIIDYLKRVGTYSSLYIIWKILAPDTTNRLNIYERWHDYNLSGTPLNNFEDHLYFYNYAGFSPEITCNELTHYHMLTQSPSAYPTPSAGNTFTQNGKVLSPHYRVELDLTCQPISYDEEEILSENLITDLYNSWEDIKPVVRSSHYTTLISPKVDFTGNWINLYSGDYGPYSLSKCCQSILSTYTEGSSIYYRQNYSLDEWTITHNFNRYDLIVQVFDSNNKRVIPKNIYPISNNSVKIEFSSPQSGTANVIIPSYTETISVPTSAWDIAHTVPNKEVISQFTNSSYYQVQPENVQLTDSGSVYQVDADFYIDLAGYGIITDIDLIFTKTAEQTTWNIYHNFDSPSLVVQTFDENWNLIFPKEVELVSSNYCKITFSEGTKGYALLKSIGDTTSQDILFDGITTWKVGNGSDLESFTPASENDVKNAVAQGTDFTSYEYIGLDGKSYYGIDVEIKDKSLTGDITEFALFDTDDNIAFYTRFKTIHKLENTDLKIFLRINKLPIADTVSITGQTLSNLKESSQTQTQESQEPTTDYIFYNYWNSADKSSTITLTNSNKTASG